MLNDILDLSLDQIAGKFNVDKVEFIGPEAYSARSMTLRQISAQSFLLYAQDRILLVVADGAEVPRGKLTTDILCPIMAYWPDLSRRPYESLVIGYNSFG